MDYRLEPDSIREKEIPEEMYEAFELYLYDELGWPIEDITTMHHREYTGRFDEWYRKQTEDDEHFLRD